MNTIDNEADSWLDHVLSLGNIRGMDASQARVQQPVIFQLLLVGLRDFATGIEGALYLNQLFNGLRKAVIPRRAYPPRESRFLDTPLLDNASDANGSPLWQPAIPNREANGTHLRSH